MTTFYEVHVADASGNRLAVFANFTTAGGGQALDYVLSVGKIGVLTMTLPATVDPTLIPLDARLSVWRSINGAPPEMDGDAVFLARMWEYGTDFTRITAFHANELFARRIIAYGTWQTNAMRASDQADDQIKGIVNENMLAGITAFRYGNPLQADVSAYVTEQANLALGVAAPVGAAWRNMMDVILEVAEASTQNGTYIAAEVVAPTEGTLEVRTYAGQRGVDHGSTSSNPVVFSESRGNLKNALLTIDHTNEVTFALAGGAGDGAARLTAAAVDATRIAASPLNRRELFVDVGNLTDTSAIQAAADAAVRQGRPVRLLEAELAETPGCTRGIHFDLGDITVIEHRGFVIDMRLDLVHELLSSDERKSEIKFRSVL